MAVNTCKRCGHEFFILDEAANTPTGDLCLDCERELTAESEREHEEDRRRWMSEHELE